MPTDSGQATYLEAVGLALDSEMDLSLIHI